MLHGRIVSSPYAHARIKSVDTRAAEAMGAVCLTFDEIPHVLYNERIVTIPAALQKDHYVLADKVRRMGEAVAAVAAETEELAERAARAVKVEYEPLPVLTDPVEAMRPGAEPIYDTVLMGDHELEDRKQHCGVDAPSKKATPTRPLPKRTWWSKATFKTPKIYHMQMEPKTAVCRPEPDGGLTVWATTQSIHNVRILLGQIFGIPLSKIDVRRMPIGGTFGSSIQMNSPIPICVALALEVLPAGAAFADARRGHARPHQLSHPDLPEAGGQERRHAAGRRDGPDCRHGGARGPGQLIPGSVRGLAGLALQVPEFALSRHGVYTNKSPSCAMQGYGNPQITFAVESLMDDLAKKLNMDPIELRLKNYVGLGGTFWGQGPTVRSVVQSDGVPQLLRDGAQKFGWHEPLPPATGRYRRGRGMARGFHTSSAGAPQPGEVIDFSGAMVKINQDGSVDVVTALMDHGGGTLEACAKLVSEELSVPLDKVDISPVGTRTSVYDVVTHATRGVYAGGGAVVKAAQIRARRAAGDGGPLPQRPAGGADHSHGRRHGAGSGLCARHPRPANDHRRDCHAVLDRKLEDDCQRRELPPR